MLKEGTPYGWPTIRYLTAFDPGFVDRNTSDPLFTKRQ